ncbi:MAG: hypothetical protein R3192_06545 [Woeseiaceae bacterium]|nr:hypothetical protein [Woeseiaceae bacterium]
MNNIESLANLAEIIGGIAVVFGISFGILEYRRYKETIKREAAATLARSFQTAELAAAIRIVLELTEPLDMEKYRELPDAEKNLIWLLFTSVESIGVLVSQGDLTLELVDEFFSIPVTEGWQKLKPYVEDTRTELSSPQAWEWYEWLYDRLRERYQQSPRVPAQHRL